VLWEPRDVDRPGAGALSQGSPVRTSRRQWTRTVRAMRWALLGGLGVLLIGNALRVPGRPNAPLDVWLFHSLIGLAVVLVALRPLLRRGDRPAWSLMAVGMLAWLVGDMWWQIVFAIPGVQSWEPGIADTVYLSFYPCAVAALLLLATCSAGVARLALWLDGLVAGLGAAAVAALTFEAISSPSVSGAAGLVELAYPSADLVLLALTIAVLAARRWRLTPPWAYLVVGCLTLVVTDTAWLLQEAARTYVQGSPWDVGWPVAFTLLALAAWQPGVPQEPHGVGQPALVVPTVVTAVSAGLLVASITRHIPNVAAVLAALALLGAAARTALAVRELRRLVESRDLALTDELTGLGNRRLLQDRLAELLDARRPEDRLAVLLLDLDRFKEVNDALGHHVGDELLRCLGPRLAGVLRPGDVLARLGGDEFAVVLGPGSDATHAQSVAARIRDTLRTPFQLDGVELHLDVSIGIALCADHASTVAGLLQCADVAMYEAKQARSGFEVYSCERNRLDRDRLQTIAQLHAALSSGQLICHYQPQCDLATGRVVGAEALVRWQHPERGLLLPESFLGLAGQVGLMARLTHRVLETALADCRQWRGQGAELSVSVNLSGLSLSDSTLPREVAALLRRHDLPASALVLEVTEDVMLADAARTEPVVAELQVLGIRLSIDDYGTGYSSLTQLRTLPLHELKLDRSYIAGLGGDGRDTAIVRSTVALAHALGLTVVAEGVESADDWEELTLLGCDRAQGYLLSPALPPSRLVGWLQQRRPSTALPEPTR
jgi:diguanylate cyclase (GGDEF)-like protein